ncbi:MAG: hypothetical protein LBS26_01505, partial [Campylobacteraceae bacterium]|nr:hypothetical protein [Campylobacteraceae bacterium]
DDFVFYSDDNKTKYFLSVFREKKRYILFRDKLPIDTNEAEYIERGGSFTGEVNGIDFDMIEDETHFVTMFLMDNTPYMQYFSDDKRYIFEYDKKTNLFKEACLIKQVGEYEYK